MKGFADKVDASSYVTKPYSVKYSVEKVEKQLKSIALQALARELITVFQGSIEIIKDINSLEARPHFANKSTFLNEYMELLKITKAQIDFVLVAGADYSDENMIGFMEESFIKGTDFLICKNKYYSVTIGLKSTSALYYVDSVDVISTLLLRLWKKVLK